MPFIYLSPSTQEHNLFVTGGTEEYYMNEIADAMEPRLRACGISFDRNTPDMTAYTSILASNRGSYDLHLALHSNAAPEGAYGTVRGTDVYYYPGSARGQRAARIIAENLRAIYPLPDKVRALPTTAIGEVARVRAPSVFIEFAYHDNQADAQWIRDNIDPIAANVVLSLTEYFGLPYLTPRAPRAGTVAVNWGQLNIRAYPSAASAIVARAGNGAALTVWNEYGAWYVVSFGGVSGFAAKEFIAL